MNREYAPDTAPHLIDALREMALANPVVAFAVLVACVALFATWAAKEI